MPAVSRSRPFEGGGNSFRVTGIDQRPGVVSPAVLVKIGGKEPACLVPQQGINPGDKVTGDVITSSQMLFDDVLGHGDECLVRALSTFHLRLATNPPSPFVGAGGRISRAAGFSVFPANWKDIGTPGEQTAEQRDFLGRGRVVGDGVMDEEALFAGAATGLQLSLKCLQVMPKARTLGIQFGQPPPNSRDLLRDIIPFGQRRNPRLEARTRRPT